jgi:uncharacterized protein
MLNTAPAAQSAHPFAAHPGNGGAFCRHEPTSAPRIRWGVVVHQPGENIDGLLAEFALTLKSRGFTVSGFVQSNNESGGGQGKGCAAGISLFDLSAGVRDAVCSLDDAMSGFGKLIRPDVELMAISRFSAFEKTFAAAKTLVAGGVAQGIPFLTSIAGRCISRCENWADQSAAMLHPTIEALWQWWGPERLYRDLALGVAPGEVRQIVCGPRWIMVEGTQGVGLAYLPRSPKNLLPRLPHLRRQSLRALANLSQSWDPLEMALGIAAINAHYNCFGLQGRAGNGASQFRQTSGQVVAIGAFPGLTGILPDCAIIETEPRPGEFPPIAMDTLLPGCGGAIVNSSALINRTLPRILRLVQDGRVALIGPSTPLTPRLHSYGIEILSGLVVENVRGLASAVQAGALPREFNKFGRFVHIQGKRAEQMPYS